MSETSADPGPGAADWAGYYRHTLGRAPRPLFGHGMDAVAAAGLAPGVAIEVGFGDGTETLALLERGWRVTAIDPTPQAADTLRSRTPSEAAARLDIVTASAAAVDLPRFDFLYAGFALSFIAAGEFGGFWARVRDRLRPGGLLAVNVFGVRDTWAGEPGLTFLDREGARALADGLDIILFNEQEDDGDSFLGPKHWHLFDLVARRPPRPARPTA